MWREEKLSNGQSMTIASQCNGCVRKCDYLPAHHHCDPMLCNEISIDNGDCFLEISVSLFDPVTGLFIIIMKKWKGVIFSLWPRYYYLIDSLLLANDVFALAGNRWRRINEGIFVTMTNGSSSIIIDVKARDVFSPWYWRYWNTVVMWRIKWKSQYWRKPIMSIRLNEEIVIDEVMTMMMIWIR